ncbi:MAG: hypothetical protein KDB23_21025 [Planctomycetales bacterium]|nr:hypothetical protein [Planctomycetales bacterium]
MSYSREDTNLRIELNTHQCELTEADIEVLERDIDLIRGMIDTFPRVDLHITIVWHAKPHDYHVKTSLMLPGRTLFTGERGTQVHDTFEACIRKLGKKLSAYKLSLRGQAQIDKTVRGTRVVVTPTQPVDGALLESAVAGGDYAAFRTALDGYEAPLSDRAGRWIQRYPDVQALIGESLNISDIVEDVFLAAFEAYPKRSAHVTLGDWLEQFIDPAVQSLIATSPSELEKLRLARSIQE